jgi:HD-like signal output (HDOD) protein
MPNWTQLREELIGGRTESVVPPRIKLPMLPHAVLEFSRKADDPNSGPAVLAAIIESDSGLTTELCRYVNSSSFGLRNKAGTAQQAITALGIRPAKLFLLSAGIQQAMKSSQSKLINFQSFWLANLERALFAREVARLLKADGDLAYAASLLHDFLLPLLSNELFSQYFRYVQTPESSRRPLIEFEKNAFGWDHSLATAQVLLNWKFPDDLVCCVLLHHAGPAVLADPDLGRTPAAAVAVAGLIPDALQQSGTDGLTMLVKLQSAWPSFQLEELAQRVSEQMQQMSPLAHQHASLQRRLEKFLQLQSAAATGSAAEAAAATSPAQTKTAAGAP